MPNNLNYLDSEGLNALWNRIRTRTLALQSSINELNTNKIELVSFDTTTGVLQQIKNDVASSIVSVSVLKTAMNLTKADVGLSGVDDNADENIIEIVKVNGGALTVNSVDKSVNVILPSAASSAPLMDGSVSVGISDAYARADHRHPSDTTRAPQVHTSIDATYGGATPAYLGHVKLTDTLNSQYTAETYTATTPSAVYNALLEAKSYADGIAEAASVGEPNVIENITINGGSPLYVWNKTVDIDLTTNLVNGTTLGSIRRSSAIPEEQGYVLGYRATALGGGTYAEGANQTVIGRFNKLTGTYVADEEPEICHYKYNIGDYTLGTWKDAPIPQYFIFDEIVSIELANRPPGSTQPDYEDDSRILGECDFKLENGILKIRYPKEEEEEPESESGTEGDSSGGGSEGEGGTTLLPYEPTEPTRVIMDAYIWINYRSGTYVPDNTYAFVIGNGTYNSTTNKATSRSNALTVDWEGNLVTSGNVYAGGANPNTQYRNGSIEFTGDVAKATAPSATQYKNIVFLDNGGRDSYHRLAFIEHYKTTANENVLQFGVYNHMAGTDSNSWPVGMRFTVNSSQYYFAQIWGNTTVSGSLLTSSGRLYSRLASGEAQIQADNNGNNKIYMYASSEGRVGIYSVTADGTQVPILGRANNSTDVQLNGSSSSVRDVGNGAQTTFKYSAPGMAYANFTWLAAWNGYTLQAVNKSQFVASSDVRLKENIKNTTIEALPIINKIQMREFDWIEPKEKYKHQPIGMIADEIENIDPYLTFGGGYTPEGTINVKAVDTFYLMGYLVKAIQELSAEVNMLKKS